MSAPVRFCVAVAAGCLVFWAGGLLIRNSGFGSYSGGELADVAELALLPLLVGASLAALSGNRMRWANGLLSFILYYAMLCAYYSSVLRAGPDFPVKFFNYALQLLSYVVPACLFCVLGGLGGYLISGAAAGKAVR